MRRAAWGGVVTAVVCVGAVPTHADTTVQAAVSAGAGYTDNALSVPTAATALPGEVMLPQSDFFATVDPSLSFIVDDRRLVATFLLSGSLKDYFQISDANSQVVRAAGLLAYQASPTWGVTADLSGLVGTQASIDPNGIVGVVPSGGGTYAQAVAGLGAFHDFSATWRGAEGARVSLFEPLDSKLTQPRSISIDNELGAQFSVKRDAFGLGIGTTLNLYDANGGVPLPTPLTVFVQGQLSWLHEISPFWNVLTSAGAGLIAADAGVGATPVGHVALTYRRELTDVIFSAQQTAVSDTTAGLSDFRSEVTAQLDLHPSDFFFIRLLAGAAHDQVFNEGFDVNSARAEGVLTFKPRDNFDVELAYGFLYQKPTIDTQIVPELLRNTVTLSVRGSYPDRRQRPVVFLKQDLQVRESEELERSENGGGIEAH